MKLKISICLLILFCWGGSRAVSQEVSPSEAPEGEVSGFSFVLPDKNGEKQCIVRGDTANFLPNGVIEITNVKTQIFREDSSDIFITTSKGRFNKTTRVVTTDEEVEIVSQAMLIKGTGLYWNPVDNKATLQKNTFILSACNFPFGSIKTTLSLKSAVLLAKSASKGPSDVMRVGSFSIP